MPPSPIYILLALSAVQLSNCACYARDCSALSTYLPCDPTAEVSACCNTLQENSFLGDICTSAGLCLRQGEYPGFLYEDGCTDPTWASSSCPQFCQSTTATMSLQPCNATGTTGGTWCCCVDTGPDCCDSAFATNVGIRIQASASSTTTVMSTATTGIASSTASTVVTITATSTQTNQAAQCPADATTTVGATVGSVLGVALLTSLGVLFWREKTRPHSYRRTEVGGAVPAYGQRREEAKHMFGEEAASAFELHNMHRSEML